MTTTLPQFINKYGIRVKDYTEIEADKQRWAKIAWRVVLVRHGGKQLTVPFWGHGGALSDPEREIASVVSSLLTDASVYESCGSSIAEYEAEFGPINAEDEYENRKEIRRILRGCERSYRGLVRWLGDDLYQKLRDNVEPY